MKYAYSSFVLILLLSVMSSFDAGAQKLKDISKADLQAVAHDLYPDANAAFLSHKGQLFMEYNTSKGGFQFRYDVHDRIKFYNDEGIEEYGNREIGFYEQDKKVREIITSIKATVYDIEGNKIVKHKLAKDDVYEEKVSDKWKTKKFALPNLRKGCIAEIKYSITSPFIRVSPKWYFQYSIPVDLTTMRTAIPEYYSYDAPVTGVVPFEVKQSEQTKSISYTVKTNNATSYNNSRKMSQERLNYSDKVKEYTAVNVPPITNEKFVTNINNYRSSIVMELATSKFPQSPINYYTVSWNEIAEDLNEISAFGKRSKDKSKDVKAMYKAIGAEDAPEVFAVKAYEYLQKSFAWDKTFRLFTDRKVSTMIKEQSASSAELNLLYISLLRMHGMEAYPVVLQTRDAGFININYPTMGKLNHVIAGINIDDKLVLADLTDRDIPFGQLPTYSLNLFGVKIFDKTAEPFNVQNPNQSKSKFMGSYKIDPAGAINGEVICKLEAYSATIARRKIKNSSGDTNLTSEDAETIISDSKIQNQDNRYDALKVEYNTSTEDFIDIIDDQLTVTPMQAFALDESPFEIENREYPIFLNNTSNSLYHMTYEIPEGYTATYVPEPLKLSLGDDIGSYYFNVQQVGNKISIIRKYKINSDIISTEVYPGLKAFYELIIEKESDQIVLKKS